MTLISYWSAVSQPHACGFACGFPQKAHLPAVSGIRDSQDLQWTSFSNSMIGSVLLFLLRRDANQIKARMMTMSRIRDRIKLNMVDTVQIRYANYMAESY